MKRTTYEQNEQIKKRIGERLLKRIEKRLYRQMKQFQFETWEERYYYNGWQRIVYFDDYDSNDN